MQTCCGVLYLFHTHNSSPLPSQDSQKCLPVKLCLIIACVGHSETKCPSFMSWEGWRITNWFPSIHGKKCFLHSNKTPLWPRESEGWHDKKNEETIKTFKCVSFLIDRTKNISRCFLYTFLKVNPFLQLLKVLGFFWSSHTIDFKPILPLGSLKNIR